MCIRNVWLVGKETWSPFHLCMHPVSSCKCSKISDPKMDGPGWLIHHHKVHLSQLFLQQGWMDVPISYSFSKRVLASTPPFFTSPSHREDLGEVYGLASGLNTSSSNLWLRLGLELGHGHLALWALWALGISWKGSFKLNAIHGLLEQKGLDPASTGWRIKREDLQSNNKIMTFSNLLEKPCVIE